MSYLWKVRHSFLVLAVQEAIFSMGKASLKSRVLQAKWVLQSSLLSFVSVKRVGIICTNMYLQTSCILNKNPYYYVIFSPHPANTKREQMETFLILNIVLYCIIINKQVLQILYVLKLHKSMGLDLCLMGSSFLSWNCINRDNMGVFTSGNSMEN